MPAEVPDSAAVRAVSAGRGARGHAKVKDLARGLRCEGCGRREWASVSVQWL